MSVYRRGVVVCVSASLALLVGCSDGRDAPSYTGAGGAQADPGPPQTTAGKWVEEVLLGVDVGDDQAVVHRWNVSPQVVLFDDTGAAEATMQAAMADLNGAIGGSGLQMQQGSSATDIRVYVGDDAALTQAKADNNVPEQFDGSAWAYWAPNGALTTVTVLIHSDEAGPGAMTHGLGRALGVLSSSDLYPDSLFTVPTAATGLPARDALLLELLYTQLQPGFTRTQLRVAFNSWWPAE